MAVRSGAGNKEPSTNQAIRRSGQPTFHHRQPIRTKLTETPPGAFGEMDIYSRKDREGCST